MSRRRIREPTDLEDALANLREWWLKEAGSDASMSLKAKLRVWADRVKKDVPLEPDG